TGCVCWWGVLVGAAMAVIGLAVTVASCGIGSPLGATLVLEAGIIIGTTGMITTQCAIEESAMVIDASVSNRVTSQRTGLSLVIDFKNETFDLYGHEGLTASTPGSPVSYSVGIVHNYEKPGDYGGHFINCGLAYNGIGAEYSRSPDVSPNSVAAVSITFGLLGSSVATAYVGWDYYHQICTWGGD
ncbi:MAG: hypothetical protein IKS35_07430, partial [Clostridia bacterium]|nr:hypothetical protein [Clostridia bacterium]